MSCLGEGSTVGNNNETGGLCGILFVIAVQCSICCGCLCSNISR